MYLTIWSSVINLDLFRKQSFLILQTWTILFLYKLEDNRIVFYEWPFESKSFFVHFNEVLITSRKTNATTLKISTFCIMTLSTTTPRIIGLLAMLSFHYSERYYANYRYAECHFTECSHVKGQKKSVKSKNFVWTS